MTTHSLQIMSLHDLTARCSCGGWDYIHTSTIDETDEQLRTGAELEHISHFASHCLLVLENW